MTAKTSTSNATPVASPNTATRCRPRSGWSSTATGSCCRGGKHEPRKGSWDTVGGFLSGAETAEENLVREGFEEIGCELRNLRFAGSYPSVYGDTGLTTIGLAFVCELPPDAEVVLSEENSEYAWFPLGNRPSLAFADCEAAVAAVAAPTSRTGSA